MDNNSKIKLAIGLVVLASIALFTWKGITGDVGIKPSSTPPRNEFIDRVEGSIESLKDSESFDKSKYLNCIAEIEDFHKQDELGINSSDNDRWKGILEKNAYSVYAPKFVIYAMSIFKGSNWSNADLVFIRSEVSVLSRSEYLDSRSTVASSFKKINNIIDRYNEIRSFINSCKSSYEINSFSNLVSKSRSYLQGDGIDTYILNCSSIVEDLRSIPEALYNKHASYLIDKVNQSALSYQLYSNYSDYKDSVHDPLKIELSNFKNIYSVSSSDFDYIKSQLNLKIDQELQDAYIYF